ncbi:short-chain dehydrogenase/reductase family 16C member 6 [Linepithema humile]|uniref:short-chain dehydrogenase/reductase family 16C member 6 n=1 Tax=Linepithema humile TaxID=83485 RepID=UPI0006232800|nr:PREDICTED: short-chain dehydrogenase/reductase family 16C member 6-like [Linepithema humile]
MIAIQEFIYLLVNLFRLILQIIYHTCENAYNNLFGIKEKDVTKDIVLITGTGHGIGKELAMQYALLGATVVCLDINQQSNEETANEIRKIKKNSQNTVYAYQCDITNREEVFKVAHKIMKEVGDVSILINNAGIMPCHTFLDHTPNEITQIFNLNVIAHIWMLQAFLPGMLRKNSGHIVAISSIAGLAGLPNIVPYSGSKCAVAGLMEALNYELVQNNKGNSSIKFTTIYPFMVDTGLCKKPKLNNRLSIALLSPKKVAAQIIKAQRRNIREMSIPTFWFYVAALIKFLPEKSIVCIRNFFDCGVDPVD